MAQASRNAVLVTGGRGFIGRHLVWRLLVSGYKTVVSVDRTPIDSVPRASDRGQLEIKLDIRDRKQLTYIFSKFDFDCVFDLASRTDVGLTAAEYEQNVEVTRSLLECVLAFNTPKYIFYSTQFVFRKEGAVPNNEQDYFPIEAYGESKIRSEMLIRAALDRGQRLILRPTYIWGPGHIRFRDGFLYRLAKGQLMVPMSRTLTRYYGYVDTICEQTIRLSEFAFEDLPLSTFYISDVPVSLKWFCEQFITALGRGRAWRIPSALIRSMGAVGEIANNIQFSFPINRLQANEMTRSYPVPLAPTLAITTAKTNYRSASESVIAWALSDPNFVRRIRG